MDEIEPLVHVNTATFSAINDYIRRDRCTSAKSAPRLEGQTIGVLTCSSSLVYVYVVTMNRLALDCSFRE